ncbi:GGDEF domain-containing protein [Devosia beringensis]|uniref:GGDEF domain-containing protein n=1 Tax=Devosia beringensis TaxID=2657486 RepID=UPI00186B6DB6|nr:sensor domain-containing diguanylate cyclase [Devosia beringensis]
MSDRSSEEELLEFLYACPVGLLECNAAGDIAMINPHAMQHLLPLTGSRDASNLFSALEQHAPELRSIANDFRPDTGKICDGHRIYVDLGTGRKVGSPQVLSCTLVKLGPDRLMATLADVSEQVVQERRLRQADTWFATLLDSVNGYATVEIDSDRKIVSANVCFTQLTGHDHLEVAGQDLDTVLGAEASGQVPRLGEQIEIAERDGWHLQEGWQQRAGGEHYWCQRLVVARSKSEMTRSGFFVVLRDVPQHNEGTADLQRLLMSDPLTGAANRRHLSQSMQQEQTHWRDFQQPFSLIVLDLDHFKSVNDIHGHPVGDLLLCGVVTACAMLLPPRGLFARLGGEEFAALLPRFDREEALALAEEMRKAIAALTVASSIGIVEATASFGCATIDEAQGSIDGLLALADARLYSAKRAGRNRVHRVEGRAA